MPTFLLPGILNGLTPDVAYAVPPGPHRILTSVSTFSYCATVDGTFVALTTPNVEPGVLLDGGFIKNTGAAPRFASVKKVNRLSTYASKASRSNPTGLWRFNEASGTTIFNQMNGNSTTYNLTAAASISLGQDGPTGDGSKSALLDGTTNSDALLAGVNPWSGGTAISFEAWVYNASWAAGHEMILCLGSVGLYLSVDTGKPFMSIFLASQFTNYMLAPGPLAADTWYHIAGTWETGDQIRLFLNGKEATSYNETTARSGTLTSSAGIFAGSFGGTTLFYSGRLADVAFYLRKLSAAEIFEHAQAKNNKS